MKEKRFLRGLLLRAFLIVIIYLAVQIISALTLNNEYDESFFEGQMEIAREMDIQSVDDVKVSFSEDGILELKDAYLENGILYVTLIPKEAGKVDITVSSVKDETIRCIKCFMVSHDGTITDLYTGNFSHYRLYHIYLILLCLAFTILFWHAFLIAYRKMRYSYHAIFCSGLGIWIGLITLVLTLAWFENSWIYVTYSLLKGSALAVILCSLPLILLFAIAMTISNISLIRHEGFRTRNALGIIISFMLIIGAFLAVFLQYAYSLFSADEFVEDMYMLLVNLFHVVFAYFECFLAGSILCGTLSARPMPAYDKDYIVILGCQMKKDGTLYPLIRGRVDKAIEFYRKQLENTGRKAVFIPSGGQGSDEQVSEAEAMKRYLVSQGIGEEQILIEDQSKNTLQNMKFSKKLIDERTPDAKAAFSTTNFHVFRSGIISRQCDFDADGMGSRTKWYFWPNAYMREVVGMLAFKWKAVIVILLPIILLFIWIQFTY